MREAATRSGVGRHRGRVTDRVYPLLVALPRSRSLTESRRPGSRRGRLELAPLRRLAALTRPHAGWLTVGIVGVAVSGVIGLAFPLVVRDLLDAAFAPGAATAAVGRALDRAMVLLVG